MYSGLLALFLMISVIFINNIIGTTSRISERNEIVVNQEFVERKLAWLVGQASGITSPTLGGSGSTLTLTGVNTALFPATFSISNQQVLLSLANGTAVPITNNRVFATSFSTTSINTSTVLQELRISLALQSSTLSSVTSSIVFSYALP